MRGLLDDDLEQQERLDAINVIAGAPGALSGASRLPKRFSYPSITGHFFGEAGS